MPPVVLDARRFPPTMYENTDVALARTYRADTLSARDQAKTYSDAASAAAEGAIAATDYYPTISEALAKVPIGKVFVSPDPTVENPTGQDRRYVHISSAPGYLLTADQPVSKNILGATGQDQGSALVAWRRSDPNAVDRTVLAKLEETVSPYDYGALGDGLADDLLALNKAADYASANKIPLYISRGSIAISATFQMRTDLHIIIGGGASIVARAGFSGTSLINVGTLTSFVSKWSIEGAGKIACLGRCAFGVYVTYGRMARITIKEIQGPWLCGIQLGDVGASSASYEINAIGVSVNANDLTDGSDALMSPQSVGVRWANCSDSFATQCYSVGYATGFWTESGSLDLVQCHAWIRPAHGYLLYAFRCGGSNGRFISCYADTPSNYGNPAGFPVVYGFYNEGYSNFFSGCTTYLKATGTNSELKTDDAIWPFYSVAERKPTIIGFRIFGGSSSYRFNGRMGGSLYTATIVGLNDDGDAVFANPAFDGTWFAKDPRSNSPAATEHGFWTYSAGVPNMFIGVSNSGAPKFTVYNAGVLSGTFMAVNVSTLSVTFNGNVVLPATKGVFVNNLKVLGDQQPAITKPSAAAAINVSVYGYTQAQANALVVSVNSIIDALRAHGIIAS